jgi:hypothetical protein
VNSPGGVVAPERASTTHGIDRGHAHARRPRPGSSRSSTGRGGPSLAFAVLVAVCLMGLVLATQSARSPDPDHGDWWSDMETLQGAQRLADTGFITGKLSTPLDDGAALGVPAYLYTNWPPGSTLATATALRAGLGPIGARAIPLAVSAATATLLFLWMRAMFGRGDAAFLAMLWLITASPFRLLSDSYTYQPWDLFGRALGLWLITEAVLSSRRPRGRLVQAGYLAAVGAVPMLSVSQLGLEMVPGTLLYGLLLPLLFVPPGADGSVRARFIRTAGIVFALGLGLIVGVTIRLAQAAWVFGGLDEAVRQLREAGEFRLRTSSDQFTNGYLAEWAMRMGRYLLPAVIVGGLTVIVALVRFARADRAVRRRWLLAAVSLGVPLVAAEAAWPLLARQHSHQHVHTIMHVLFSTSVLCGLGCAWAVRSARARVGDRALGLAALMVVPLALNWVVFPRHPYGNVAEEVDWKRAAQVMRVLDGATGSSRYVYADRSGVNPIGLYFLDRLYLRADNPRVPDRVDDPTVVHFATAPPSAPARVLAQQAGFLVYDPGSTGASPADLVAGAQLDHALIGLLNDTALEGIIFQPWLGGDHASATIAVPPGPAGTLTVHVLKSTSAGDGAHMAVRLTEGGDTESYEVAMYQMGAANPVSFPLPEAGPAQLTIEVDCGPSHDCDFDELGVTFAMTRSP